MTILTVPDMSCGHCKASVMSALSGLPDAGEVAVDLDAKTVTVTGPAQPAALIRALEAVGFPASILAVT
jgi:copper chaperone